MALLMAIYSSSFGNGLDAKRFCRSSFDRVQHTHTHTSPSSNQNVRVCVTLYMEIGGEKNRKIFARRIYTRYITAAEVFTVLRNHKGSFE